MSLAERLRRVGAARGLPQPDADTNESQAPSTPSEPATRSDLLLAKVVEPREDSGGVFCSLQSTACSLSAGGARAEAPPLRFVPDEEVADPFSGDSGDGPGGLLAGTEGLLAGTEPCLNLFGSFLLKERPYPAGHAHGDFLLKDCLDGQDPALGVLVHDAGLRGLDLTRAVFLDTETTGLSGGTGTVAFLVGLAGFDSGAFVVRQLFMRDFDEEPAMLHQLASLLEEASCLVTYNGKSFDLPLLAGRYIASRLPRPRFLELPHLDLLHAARRIWRHELPEMSLGYVERAMLGVHRGEDLPGALIPAMYVRYLLTRRAGLMEPVLRHNELDVLSLASVLAAGMRACRGEGSRAGERYGVARTLESMRSRAEAVETYRQALALASEPALERKIRKDLAAALARLGNHDEAEAAWLTVADRWEDLDALEALAKRAEHHHRAPGAAEAFVHRALARLNSPVLRNVGGSVARRRQALLTRLARLKVKNRGKG
jgi:hypothetical protein